MTTFSRPVPPYRLVTIDYGQTIQRVAAIELGDANRWPELVWLNNLVWPYITDDPERVAEGVLLSGSFIKIPAPAGIPTTDQQPIGQVFERDCLITDGLLSDDGSGDFQVVTGSKNLVQQLENRLKTPKGQAIRHPDYGCMLYRLIGRVNAPTLNVLASQYAQATLLSDYRVSSLRSVSSAVDKDKIKITATAVTIAGGAVDVATTG